MTMTVDNQHQRHHLGSMPFSGLPYTGAQFSDPWSSSSGSSYSGSLGSSSLPYDVLPKPQAPRSSTVSMPYSSVPATTAGLSGSTVSYNPPELSQPQSLLSSQRASYDPTYTSAPSQTSSYAPSPSSYPAVGSYGQSLAQQQHDQSARRISPPAAASLPQSQTAFGEALDGARGMLAISQTDITPRNIYGPQGDRSSADSYGFPTHSSHSSISSASGYPNYFSGSSVDGSVTDYSSASESVDGMNSRTLPRPNGVMAAALPPAPQSMMGSFNSKVSTNTQKKHKCKVCDKRFTRPSSLQTHMYSHTGEKPFACEIPGCGRNFSVVSNLRRHRKVHKSDRSIDEHDHGSPEGSWTSSTHD